MDEAHPGPAPKDSAHGVSDIPRAEPGGRHLVQKRLEGVEVVLVDQSDLDRSSRQAGRRRQPGETGADHDGSRCLWHSVTSHLSTSPLGTDARTPLPGAAALFDRDGPKWPG